MQLKIWGCRGSVPTPGPATVRCGGNTSCVEVSVDGETVLVLDAGTGIRDLGFKLMERGTRRVRLLLTHLHLDHIEGLRFFAPMWDKRVTLDIWGPPSPVVSLQERIARSFSPPLFPIDLREVPAQVTFHDVPRRRFMVEGVSLRARLVMHPGPTVGYRLEAEGVTVAYMPDHEPAFTGIADRPKEWISGSSIADGVDLLLHDAQYFEEEYAERFGWGHSSVVDTVAFARAVGAQSLMLFHHEPRHADDALERLEDRARALFGRNGNQPTLAREGMVVEMP